MTLDQLDKNEILALIGLCKWMVRADGVLSDEELGALGEISSKVGWDRWEECFQSARVELTTRAAVHAAVKDVIRLEARALIYDVLVSLAGADELVKAEERLLQWLGEEWHIAPQTTDKVLEQS